MKRTLLHRLAILPVLLIGVSLLAFLFIHLTPGDPARQLAGGAQATERQIEQVRADYGLDRPLPIQYVSYVRKVAEGDLGISLRYKKPVGTLFLERFPATIQLVLAALLLGVPTGLLMGIRAARRRDSWADHLITLISLVCLSGPLFWIGYILAWLLSAKFGVFPLSGQLPPFTDLEPITHMTVVDALLRGQWSTFGDAIWYLALPAITLGIVPFALIARFARASFIEVLEQDYVMTVRAYGIPERQIIWHHVAKNALLPLVTLFGILVPTMLVASLIAEVVFSWQGTGTLLLSAIQDRDYSVVQGVVLVLGLLFVVSNAIVDVSYTFLDPRTRRA